MAGVGWRVFIVSVAALLTGPVLAENSQIAPPAQQHYFNGTSPAMDGGMAFPSGDDGSVVNPDGDDDSADAPDNDDSDQDSPDDNSGGGDNQDPPATIPA